MSRSPEQQELIRANDDLDQGEHIVANLAAAEKRGQEIDRGELKRRLDTLELLLAPDFRITRATGKVDDREGFLATVKSGDRSFRSHETSIDSVRTFEESGAVTGGIETDGDYGGKPVRGHFRYVKVFLKEAAGWKCVAWQNTPISDPVTATVKVPAVDSAQSSDPGSVRAVYEEVCREHAGITDFRAKLLALLPLASGTGLFLLFGKEAIPQDRMHYLLPLGIFGALVTLGLYFYELRGIQLCKILRNRGKQLERAFLLPQSGAEGAFSGRPKARGYYVGAEGAGHVIYSAVMGAWGYVAEMGWPGRRGVGSSSLAWAIVFVIAAHVITQLLSRLIDEVSVRGKSS